MLELKNAAIGTMLGALLIGGTAVQASAQETQDTSKATTQDTSAYSAPVRADTSAPAGVTDTSAPAGVTDTSTKAGTDTSMAKMGHDSALSDTSQAGEKAWKKKNKQSADSSSAK
jgi:hypothetical protein